MPEPRPTSPRGLGYLPGVDGLRAFSVIAVLLYHAELTWLPGGFLGVEVFFVISGYLITLLLVNEFTATGTVSLRTFWFRRARRLLPALFTLLLVTLVAVAAFWQEELAELRGQVAAAVTYCTNWYGIVTDQSYFAAAGRPPVLRHLWSLAVEEQFYLVWPLLLLGLMYATRNRRGPLALVVGLGAAASALWMAVLYQPAVDPSRIYYGTDTRASGLLLGATLAFLWRPHELSPRTPAAAVDTATVAAVGGLGLCFLRIHEWDRFLYRGGFVVVGLLTVVAIAGVAHPSSTLGRLALGNRVMTWIGVRSYGLYLWHWPIYVFTRPGVDLDWGTNETLALRLALTVVAAELSYRFVEVPIRGGALGRWFVALRAGDRPRRLVRRQLTLVAVFAIAVAVTPATMRLVDAKDAPSAAEDELLLDGTDDADNTQAIAADPGLQTAETTTAAAVDGASATPDGSTDTAAPADATASSPPVAPDDAAVAASVSLVTSPRMTPGTVTVITDSVLLRIQDEFTSDLEARGWTVDYRGKAALMLDKAVKSLRQTGTRVGEVVVIGLGYNSLWERDRAHFDRWADKFDREAEELLSTLKDLGAKRFVWVTLREPDRDIIPKDSGAEYKQYAWFFPYVNERLRLLDEAHDDVILADWAAISNVSGITGDLIHLNGKGYRLMRDLIISTGGF